MSAFIITKRMSPEEVDARAETSRYFADIPSQDVKNRMRAEFGRYIKGDHIGARTSFDRRIKTQQLSGGTAFEITAMATTDRVDQMREVVLPDGCDWSTFEQLGKHMYADHRYGIENRIGFARSYALKATASNRKGWFIRAIVKPDPAFPKRGAFVEAAQDTNVGISIGFDLVDGSAPTEEEKRTYGGPEYMIRKCAIFELSFTLMPCCLAAMTDAVTVDEEKAMEVSHYAIKHASTRHLSVLARKRLVLVV